MEKRVNDFARENGYNGAEFLKKWNGYDAYEPYMDKDSEAYLGLPLMILVKGEEIRMSTPQEAMDMIGL